MLFAPQRFATATLVLAVASAGCKVVIIDDDDGPHRGGGGAAEGGAPGTTTTTTVTTGGGGFGGEGATGGSGGEGGDGGEGGLGGAGGGGDLPDLTVDAVVLGQDLEFDLVDYESDPCLLGEQCLNGTGERLVMRFTTRTANIGPVDFVIGDPANSPGFVFSPCHGHYHYYDYAAYRLLDSSGNQVVAGHKQGFALIDIGIIDPGDPNTNPNPVYDGSYQGIQHGWYDEYFSGLACQWIDVTGVAPGQYQLEVEVNPSQTFEESRYDNNVATIDVTIPECPFNCSYLDSECTFGQCVSGTGCVAMPMAEGALCEDDEFCTDATTCENGVCGGGVPKECAPAGGCYVGSCDEALDTCLLVPGNDGQACDDGSPCTDATTCDAGACTNGVAANDGQSCDDGVSCTSGTLCSAGECTGGTGPTIYFSDDFSDDSAGWTRGPTWEIGAARATSGADLQGDDPENDHSSTSDDGVAGVVLGGFAPPTLHDFYWLESPAFDTSAASGSVVFGFYRWLNSDFDPWMVNRVEVYDGTQWVILWTSSGAVVDAPAGGGLGWNYQQLDITPHKSSSTRVRFGYSIGELQSLYTIGSWNVDDVVVAGVACP